MARRRTVGRRRYARRVVGRARRTYGRIRRRASKAKPPIEMIIAGAAIPFTPAADSFGGGPYDSVVAGDLVGLMDNLKVGFLPFVPERNAHNVDIAGYINPFNMNVGRYTKMLILAGIAGSIRKKVSRQSSLLIQKIPLLGKYAS